MVSVQRGGRSVAPLGSHHCTCAIQGCDAMLQQALDVDVAFLVVGGHVLMRFPIPSPHPRLTLT